MLDGVRETEATPYLYYVLAWPWARAFGLGGRAAVALRARRDLAVPVSYAAGAALCSPAGRCRRRGSRRRPPVPRVVRAGGTRVQPLVLLGACTVLFLGRALRAPRRADLALWAVASSLAIATHYFAVFLVAAEAAWLVAGTGGGGTPPVALVCPPPSSSRTCRSWPRSAATARRSAPPLLSRVVGTPKALVVGYSFPAEVAGSVLAAALVAVGLALLATRARRTSDAGLSSPAPSRSPSSGWRSAWRSPDRLPDRAQRRPRGRPGRDLPRSRVRHDPPRARRGRRAGYCC